jgi:hypothetical protein
MIRYRGSMLRGDGGWDVVDIIVKADSTREEISAAISAWRTLREEALSSLRMANRRYTEQTIVANPTLILTFGKYVGRALAEVISIDREYVEWLANEARDEEVRISARYLVNLADAVQRLAAISQVQAAVEEAEAAGVNLESGPLPPFEGPAPF